MICLLNLLGGKRVGCRHLLLLIIDIIILLSPYLLWDWERINAHERMTIAKGKIIQILSPVQFYKMKQLFKYLCWFWHGIYDDDQTRKKEERNNGRPVIGQVRIIYHTRGQMRRNAIKFSDWWKLTEAGKKWERCGNYHLWWINRFMIDDHMTAFIKITF